MTAADDEYTHAHHPTERPTREQVMEHNLRVVVNRLQRYEDTLDAALLAIRSLEVRLERVEGRLAAVERATPLRRPPNPRPPHPG